MTVLEWWTKWLQWWWCCSNWTSDGWHCSRCRLSERKHLAALLKCRDTTGTHRLTPHPRTVLIGTQPVLTSHWLAQTSLYSACRKCWMGHRSLTSHSLTWHPCTVHVGSVGWDRMCSLDDSLRHPDTVHVGSVGWDTECAHMMLTYSDIQTQCT